MQLILENQSRKTLWLAYIEINAEAVLAGKAPVMQAVIEKTVCVSPSQQANITPVNGKYSFVIDADKTVCAIRIDSVSGLQLHRTIAVANRKPYYEYTANN